MQDVPEKIEIPEGYFSQDPSVDLQAHVIEFAANEQPITAKMIMIENLVEMVLCYPFRPELKDKYGGALNQMVTTYKVDLELKGKDMPKSFLIKYGLEDVCGDTVLSLIDRNPLIEQSGDIGGFGFFKIDDFKKKEYPRIGFSSEEYKCVMVSLSRRTFNNSNIKYRIPLAYAVFIIPMSPFVDTIFLTGIWLSVYGQLRYVRNNRSFPKGLGLNLISFSLQHLMRKYQRQFTFVGLDALLNTRKMLSTKNVPIYRYNMIEHNILEIDEKGFKEQNVMFYPFNIDYDAKEQEQADGGNPYHSVDPEEDMQKPNYWSTKIAQFYKDYYYFKIDDLLPYDRPATINCSLCGNLATFECTACKRSYFCGKKCFLLHHRK